MREETFYFLQMYCKKFIPDRTTYSYTILMLHGAGHTGSCYEVTPDGRCGWAYFFTERGFEVYVIDWPGFGRSGVVPFERINGEFIARTVAEFIKGINKKVILFTHSMSGPYGWKIAELVGDKMKAIIAVAPGPPGNIQSATRIIKKTKNFIKVKFGVAEFKLDLSKPYLLSEQFIKDKFIGRNSKLFPRKYFQKYKASIQTEHPRLIYERFNINNSQLQIKDFSKFKKLAILILAGESDAEYPKELIEKIRQYFTQRGIRAESWWLRDLGIKGNGHMLMLEKNSNKIATLILRWIQRRCKIT